MAHWSEKYIGQPYILGINDCARFAAKIKRTEFQFDVPDEIDIDRAASRLGRIGQMEDLVSAYGEKTESPIEGDAVLMLCRGRPSHLGIYCIVNGEPCVLHAMENAKMVVLHKIRELERVFLKVEGYYKWK